MTTIDDARGVVDGLQNELEQILLVVAGLLRELHSMERRAEAVELRLEELIGLADEPRQLASTREALARLRGLRERLRYLEEVPLSLARTRELPEDLETALRSELGA